MMNSIYFVFDLGGTLLKLNTPHFTHLSKMEQKKIGLETGCYDMIFSEITKALYYENQKKADKQVPTSKSIEGILHKYDICLTTDDVIGLMWQMLGKESCEYLPPLQGVLDLLDDLYEQDIQIYGISNTVLPENLLNPILSRHNMKKYFRRIVLSSECGYRKPSDEFFEILEQYINYQKTDTIVLIGDSYENDISPAIKRGYDTIYIGTEKIENNYQPKYVAEDIGKLKKIIFKKYLIKK